MANGGANHQPPAVSEEERAKRADEIRKKQHELQVASEVETRLLMEAQRRQEEEALHRHQQQMNNNNNTKHAAQRLDSLVGGSSVKNDYNGPMNGVRPPSFAGHMETIGNNNGLNPRPPERHSSYGVVQQQQMYSPSIRSPEYLSSSTNKRVQFSSTSHHSTSHHDLSTSFDANANQDDMSPSKQQNPNVSKNLLVLSVAGINNQRKLLL